MEDWPEGLPGFLIQGFSEQRPDTVIETEMDTGAPKVRQRYSAAPYMISGTMSFTKEQSVIFDDFHKNTIAGGALSFNFRHPRTGVVERVRIVGAPDISSASDKIFRYSISMRVFP